MNIIGTCVDDELIEEIFGSVSEFALQVENNGNEFQYGKFKVTYNEETDIHTFWI